MNPFVQERSERTRWFLHDRFGLFIHWGLYAIPARGEWIRSVEQIPDDRYRAYFDEFNPDHYNPRDWARQARQAGMKYAVLTAKHHDGFCLFDSALTDWKATKTKAGRDLVAEYVDAFRAEGLKVGLYYSIIDWNHPDYPAYRHANHPMRENEAYRDRPENFERYLDYMHGQVRELCTQYGKLDILWFDFSYGDMSGEKWRATELVRMVRDLQPGILIDNRLEASGSEVGSLLTPNPKEYAGDFASPEQIIPAEGMTDSEGTPIPWEACFTMNNHWGYAAADHAYKPAPMLIRKLVECVSKNGNMLLNVGPTARGDFPPESQRILAGIGAWMRDNAASIYGCGAAGLDKPEWGRYTCRGHKLYAHVIDPGIGALALPGLFGKIRKARLLRDGSEVLISEPWNSNVNPGAASLSLGRPDVFTFPYPDPVDTVIELELEEN